MLDTCAFGVHASRASSRIARARVTDYKRRVIRAETKRRAEVKFAGHGTLCRVNTT